MRYLLFKKVVKWCIKTIILELSGYISYIALAGFIIARLEKYCERTKENAKKDI